MARRFHFNLDPVLRYRKRQEDDCKKDFALASRAVEEQRLQMDDMQGERDDTQDDVRALYAEKAAFDQVVEEYRYINTLDLYLAAGAKKMDELEKVREDKRQVFIEARKKKRALELLKEKRKAAHDQQEAREFQQMLDEQSIQAQRRKKGE